MEFPQMTIRPSDDAKAKGRSFTVHEVATIFARDIVPDAANGTTRPVLLAYAGTPSAVRAFTANLRAGETAESDRHRLELLRAHGYRYQLSTPTPGQALVLAYLPDLFHLQPGAHDHQRLRFVNAPPTWWLDRQERLLTPELGPPTDPHTRHQAREQARAMAFVARLDARCPLPIANDPAFHLALFERARDEPWTATADDAATTGPDAAPLTATGLDALGLDPPLLCDVAQDAFADFLATATADLMPADDAAPASLRRATSLRKAPSPQLSLDFMTADFMTA